MKLILVLVVLPLLMYACRQKLAKDGPRGKLSLFGCIDSINLRWLPTFSIF